MGSRRRPAAAGAVALAVAVCLGAVATAGTDRQPAPGAAAAATGGGLSRFADCAAFVAYVRPLVADAVEHHVRTAYHRQVHPARASSGYSPAAVLGGSPAPDVQPAPMGLSGHEPGVVRADVAQSAGSLVYTLGRRDGRSVLDVVETSGRPRTLGSVAFDAYPGDGQLLLLGNSRALAISEAEGIWPGPPQFHTPRTALTLLDVADPANPRVLASERIAGRFVNARTREGVAYVALSSGVRVAAPEHDPSVPEERAVARARRDALAAEAGDLLPVRADVAPDGTSGGERALVGCTDVLAPARPSGLGILSVLTIDGRRGAVGLTGAEGTGIAAATNLVHAADDRLYVATDTGRAVFRWSGGRLARVPAGVPRSVVHAFDASRPAGLRYLSSLAVPGLLDHTGFSAHRGHLRLVTNELERWESSGGTRVDRGSHVLILAEREGRLVRVAEAAGTAGVRYVYEVWWLGDRAALATARDGRYRFVDLAARRPRLGAPVPLSGASEYVTAIGGRRVLEIGHPPGPGRRATMKVATYDLTGATAVRRGAMDYGIAGAEAPNDPRSLVMLPGTGKATNRQIAIFAGWELNRGPGDKCTGPRRDNVRHLPEAGSEPYRLRCPFADKRLVHAVRIDGAGRVSKVGRYADRASILRVLLVGDRVVAVTQNSVSVLDRDGLRHRGSAPTAWRAGPAR